MQSCRHWAVVAWKTGDRNMALNDELRCARAGCLRALALHQLREICSGLAQRLLALAKIQEDLGEFHVEAIPSASGIVIL